MVSDVEGSVDVGARPTDDVVEVVGGGCVVVVGDVVDVELVDVVEVDEAATVVVDRSAAVDGPEPRTSCAVPRATSTRSTAATLKVIARRRRCERRRAVRERNGLSTLSGSDIVETLGINRSPAESPHDDAAVRRGVATRT